MGVVRAVRAIVNALARRAAWLLTRRLYLVMLAGAIAVFALAAMALATRGLSGNGSVQTAEPVGFKPVHAGALQVSATAEIDAGESFDVEVSGDFGEADAVTLLVDTGYRQLRLVQPATASVGASGFGTASFRIDAMRSPMSGIVRLVAIAGDRTGETYMQVWPGQAVDPLDLHLGPRTIDATGTTATTIAIVATDSFGNPVRDGTPIEVLVTRPDLRTEQINIATQDLLGSTRIQSDTVAGRTKVAVSVADAAGQELDFLQTAGSPVPFDLEFVDDIVPADGRSLVRVRTTTLIDEFGNGLPEGVTVTANVEGVGGVRRLQSQVIKGVAEFTIEAPRQPGVDVIVAHASGTDSNPLQIDYPPMVEWFDIEIGPDIDGLRITVGPVISTLGAYIPDGSMVTVISEHGMIRRPTLLGEADIVIPESSGLITIEILGFERIIEGKVAS